MIQTEEMLDVVVRTAAWAWMRRKYLQSGPACPACSEPITGARALAAWQDMREVYCAGCGHRFRPTFGTPIYETRWQPEEFVQLLLLDQAGRTPAQIAASLGKSTASISDMIERIRLHHADVPRCAPSTSDPQALTAQG